MKLRVAAVLVVTLVAPAFAQIPDDIQRLRFTVQPQLPSAQIVRRPLPPTPVESGWFGRDYAMHVTGMLTVDQLASGHHRATLIVSRLRGRVGTQSFDTPLNNAHHMGVEFDQAGRYFAIQPSWLDLPLQSPSAQLGQSLWQQLRSSLVDGQKDWALDFASYGVPLTLPSDIAIGTVILSRDKTEMLAERLEVLEARVRGNVAGFHVDLPRGGTLSTEQRDVYAGLIRARGLPYAIKRDVRIRGTTTYAGRTYILADGKSNIGQVDSTVTLLFDPVSGWAALARVAGTVGVGNQRYAIGNYWRLQLP